MEPQEEESPEVRKIIFTGLDNAGKTSIILTMLREMSKISTIRPTRNAERRTFEFLGMKISEWDLGGQERFRKTYLDKAHMIFRDTDVVIYVVDVQDHERIVDSCVYLNEVIKKFVELELEPSIHIFFHKFDPGVNNIPDSKMEQTIMFLKRKIKDFQNYEKFTFHKTTVFNLPTIVNAMSELLIKLYPRAKLIDTTIQEFVDKFGAEGVELLDNNSLIISSYYKDPLIEQILNALSPFFLRLNDGFDDIQGVEEKDNYVAVERLGKFFIFKRFKLIKSESPYYLLLCKDDPSFNKEEFDVLVNLLNEILSQEIL